MTTFKQSVVRSISARPLTDTAFAPYGEVVHHTGTQRRRYLNSPFDRSPEVGEQKFWVSRIDTAMDLPCRVHMLERHVHSSQTFIPLTPTAYLVVVAPSLPDGSPDTERLEAFLAAPSQGVCYRRGVWHQGVAVLAAPAQFAIFMGSTGDGNDDEFLSLPETRHTLVHIDNMGASDDA